MAKLMGPAVLVLSLILTSAPAAAQTAFERQVLDTLNQARTNPAAYAETLRKYRGFFHANLVSLPGETADFETAEGVAVVDETIAFLDRQSALAPVAAASVLEASAADHVRDQAASGDTGHDSGDGASPGDRVRRRGGGEYVAEVIAYGPVDAIDVVRQLIVDDGVADRGHRTILYSPELRFAGVSCGPHPEFRTMCVIDLAMTPDGRSPNTRVAHNELPARNGY
jgi:uncharacterized protein YkwD